MNFHATLLLRPHGPGLSHRNTFIWLQEDGQTKMLMSTALTLKIISSDYVK